jgi:hypothetical protein
MKMAAELMGSPISCKTQELVALNWLLLMIGEIVILRASATP